LEIYTFDLYKQFLKKALSFPFLSLSFIFGHPGESFFTANQTIKRIHWIFKNFNVYDINSRILVPYPGTPLFNYPEKYGMKILTKDWDMYYRFSYPVYRLEVLTRQQIWSLFLHSFNEIVKEMEKRLNIN